MQGGLIETVKTGKLTSVMGLIASGATLTCRAVTAGRLTLRNDSPDLEFELGQVLTAEQLQLFKRYRFPVETGVAGTVRGFFALTNHFNKLR